MPGLGESTGNGRTGTDIGPMTSRPRFFNPHPIQGHATD